MSLTQSNRKLNIEISGLWLDTYVCVRVMRPVPKTQPSIADPCSELYKAASGDTCEKIVGKHDDLSLADL